MHFLFRKSWGSKPLDCPLPVAWLAWLNMASDHGIAISRPKNLRQFFETWLSTRVRNPFWQKLWVSTFYAIAWSLWMKRNSMVFQQQAMDCAALCDSIRWRVAMRTKAWKEDVAHTAEELAWNFGFIPILFAFCIVHWEHWVLCCIDAVYWLFLFVCIVCLPYPWH